MNLINTLLILIIIIYLINYLTNGSIVNAINNYSQLCKNKIENFMGLTYINKKGVYSNSPDIPFINQTDFPYMIGDTIDNFKDETYHLHNFINMLIKPNINIYELTLLNSKRILANKEFQNEIINYLIKIFNSGYFIFSDIKLLNNLYYYKNPKGKDIEIFKFSANVSLNNEYNNKSLGNLIFAVELFIHENIHYHNYYNLPDNYNYEKTNKCFGCTKKEYITIFSIKLLGNGIYNNLNTNKLDNSINDYFINRSQLSDTKKKKNSF